MASLSIPDYPEVRDCQACPLYREANNPVLGEGPVTASIAFLGEGPGEREDKTGRPFVGKAGQVLEQVLHKTGLRRGDVYITNVVRHRPPKNRVPSVVEIAACRPFLDRELEGLTEMRVLVCLGATAQGLYFPQKTGQGALRALPSGVVVVGVYHPAYYLRNPVNEVMEQIVGGIQAAQEAVL